MGGHYGEGATEAFAAFLNAVRGGDAREVGGAWEALNYWLLIMRAGAPDFADPRVQAAVVAPRWARHGPEERPEPGLYLRYAPRRGWLGALICCAGNCPPDWEEGWGWLYGPLPWPPGWCDAPVPGRAGP